MFSLLNSLVSNGLSEAWKAHQCTFTVEDISRPVVRRGTDGRCDGLGRFQKNLYVAV